MIQYIRIFHLCAGIAFVMSNMIRTQLILTNKRWGMGKASIAFIRIRNTNMKKEQSSCQQKAILNTKLKS